MAIDPPVLDPKQLKRIESIHRGFLYQHLYTAGCLLLAAGADASAVVVEADEDIEIVCPDRRLYVQVKTRSEALTEGDIEGAIQRFARLRREHADGRRPGAAAFSVLANVQPGPKLEVMCPGTEFAPDSPQEGAGFEPSVPLKVHTSRNCLLSSP
jgi:hypothetical protein